MRIADGHAACDSPAAMRPPNWLVAVVALACSQGLNDPPDGGGGGGGGGGRDAGPGSGGDDIGDACGGCVSPPPARCTSPCESEIASGAGACVGTTCDYPSEREACPRGCDEATGLCRGEADPIPECAQAACGTMTACGASCEAGSGCCTSETYEKSSGFTYNGYQLCCDGADPASAVGDCGSGSDHWVSEAAPNCGTAHEGSDNYGGPCVRLTCTRRLCR